MYPCSITNVKENKSQKNFLKLYFYFVNFICMQIQQVSSPNHYHCFITIRLSLVFVGANALILVLSCL